MKPFHKLSSELESALLELHRATNQRDLWQQFREIVRQLVEVDRVTLFLGHIGMGDARVVFTDPPIEKNESWYEARGKTNPFSPWIEQHLEITHYLFRDVVGSPEEFRKTSFYRDFASHEGWDKGLSCLFWQHEEVRGMFSLYRGEGRSEFTEEEIENVLWLRKQVDVALDRVLTFQRERNFRFALEDFNRKMPVPLALVDWDLKTVFANTEAQKHCAIWNYGENHMRMYNLSEHFRIPAEILSEITRLRLEIESIPPQQLRHQLPGMRIVESLRNAAWKVRLHASLHGLQPIARPGFFLLFQEPIAEDGSMVTSDRSERRIRDLQRLTQAEREILVHVCKGLTNQAIADVLHKSVLTVKTQLNSVFQKLEVKNRATLIHRYR